VVDEIRAAGGQADPIVVDTGDAASIAAAAQEIETRYGRLDVLINNAGVLLDLGEDPTPRPTATTVDRETLEYTFNVNLFGVVDLTQRLLPLLKQSEAGRIVNLSSILGSLTLHADPTSPIYSFKTFAYNASKAALNSFTIHLAHELRDTPIKVNSAHPGWVKTDMGGPMAMMEIEDGIKTTLELATLPADGPTGTFTHLGQPLPW